MGRKSRAKRERRLRAGGPIARAAQGVSPASLAALLEAAAASPTASQSLPSLALVFESLLKHPAGGDGRADAGLLPELVDAAREEKPAVRASERTPPRDARAEVLVPWRGSLHRILPGRVARPLAVVQDARLLAQAIDPILVERVGYGLADAAELVLRRVGHTASTLAPAWRAGERPEAGTPPRISAGELEAAEGMEPIAHQVAQCEHPDRAALCLQAFSVPRKRLTCRADDPIAAFDSTIAVRLGRGRMAPIPAGMMLGALDRIAAALALRARSLDASAEERWKQAVKEQVAAILIGSGQPVRAPIVLGEESVVHALVEYSSQRLLVVDAVAGLHDSTLRREFEASSEALDLVSPGRTHLLLDGSTIAIADDAGIGRLQVVAPTRPAGTTATGFSRHGDTVTITLHDLRWLARTAARRSADLWHYVDDLLDDDVEVLAGDGIEIWERWRAAGKTFHPEGVPGDFTSHGGSFSSDADWQAGAANSRLEGILLSLGLPECADWPQVEIYQTDREPEVFSLFDPFTYHDCFVLGWEVPVGFSIPDSGEEAFMDRGTMLYTVLGIVSRLLHARTSFCRAMRASGVESCRIEFVRSPEPLAAPLAVSQRSGEAMTVAWDPSLEDAVEHDMDPVDEAAGRILAEMMAPDPLRDDFLEAWSGAPPGPLMESAGAVGAVGIARHRDQLPDPTFAHESDRAAVLGRLVGHLTSSSVLGRTYGTDEAKRIESETVYPWLLGELRGLLRGCDGDSVLGYALEQLEFAQCERWWDDQRAALLRGPPAVPDPGGSSAPDSGGSGAPDPGGSEHEDGEKEADEGPDWELLVLAKAVSLIVEEVVAHPPDGAELVGEMMWSQLLSVAELCAESCLRSDFLHSRLGSADVVVDGIYRAVAGSYDGVPEIDMEGYRREQSRAALPAPGPDAAEGGRRDSSGVDGALRSTWGFGLDALTSTLATASEWPTRYGEAVVSTEVGALVEAALERNGAIPAEEYRGAIGWLTLRRADMLDETSPDGLIRHGDAERRGARVAVRPLIDHQSGVLVLPWTARHALSILGDHLEDGTLPWPEHSLKGAEEDPPGRIVRAVRKLRLERNRLLESECARTLEHPRLIVRQPAEPGGWQHRGPAPLPDGVAAVCIDARTDAIWVIGAEDPAHPRSLLGIRRLVDRFHRPGGRVDELLAGVREVADSAQGWARASGAERPDRGWSTRGLIVTRRVTPAAFAVDSKVPFCTLDEARRTVLGEPDSEA